MQVKEKLMAGKRLESLGTLSLNLASDYYTEQEMKVKFKKPKKKVCLDQVSSLIPSKSLCFNPESNCVLY